MCGRWGGTTHTFRLQVAHVASWGRVCGCVCAPFLTTLTSSAGPWRLLLNQLLLAGVGTSNPTLINTRSEKSRFSFACRDIHTGNEWKLVGLEFNLFTRPQRGAQHASYSKWHFNQSNLPLNNNQPEEGPVDDTLTLFNLLGRFLTQQTQYTVHKGLAQGPNRSILWITSPVPVH